MPIPALGFHELLSRKQSRLLLLIWVASMGLLVLGFGWVTPNARLGKVEAQIVVLSNAQAAHEQQDKTMIRWMCVKSTPTEQHLAGLVCQ